MGAFQFQTCRDISRARARAAKAAAPAPEPSTDAPPAAEEPRTYVTAAAGTKTAKVATDKPKES